MLFDKYGVLGKTNKLNAYEYYFKMLLGKLDSLFKWKNLPETVDKSFLNSNLFLLGYSAFYELDGKIYTNFGGIGGTPNENYYPTEFILSNPIQGSKTFIINSLDKDTAVLMYNTESDKQFLNGYGKSGIYTLIKQTATLLADNLQSINLAQINCRVQTIFTASDDSQAKSAEQLVKRMYNADPYQILISDELSPITVSNVEPNTSDIINTLLQVHQYILADFYNQIGIPTTPYQKKERLITDEIKTLDKTNNCNIYEMLTARRTAIKKINSLFNTSISIDLAEWITSTEKNEVNQTDQTDQTDQTNGEGGEQNGNIPKN